jgi:hypothetical protein
MHLHKAALYVISCTICNSNSFPCAVIPVGPREPCFNTLRLIIQLRRSQYAFPLVSCHRVLPLELLEEYQSTHRRVNIKMYVGRDGRSKCIKKACFPPLIQLHHQHQSQQQHNNNTTTSSYKQQSFTSTISSTPTFSI